ncbi:Manganese transport system membrane protein MntB [Rubripirellula lacrimiformis]|uniref:Manganese transport system membrane protein MntB n=1 Tax=Rubripirellula lacrimiformis TaxID=1930273 RepID=A0A517NHA6_9BACT|nr:iron chelate uptake ABC transporter family permease subunit [Rubripirellula lacrimiformis]QDT06519.1 Manganese transport system membrane protein MntB [Rubripirellula lacrimiformis]
MSLFDTLFAYNTMVVLAGTMLLGVAAGVTGTFLLLRGRALAGDVIGHAALPGVAIAFLVHSMIAPESGKSLAVMLIGGAISSGLGMVAVLWLRRVGRLPEDAVLAIVLSTFFGAGVVIMPIVQASPTGSQAGLPGFIFGQAASIRQADVWLLGSIAVATILASMTLIKEWTLMCFDEGLATVLGYPIRRLDLLLMALVVAVSVAGMQAVGLLLIVALLIIPASAARYWSDSIRPNIWISGGIGALSAGLGSMASAVVPKLSTGAIIVVFAALLLAISVLVGRQHGLIFRWRAISRLKQQNLAE